MGTLVWPSFVFIDVVTNGDPLHVPLNPTLPRFNLGSKKEPIDNV